jgi:hypothetical protein
MGRGGKREDGIEEAGEGNGKGRGRESGDEGNRNERVAERLGNVISSSQ